MERRSLEILLVVSLAGCSQQDTPVRQDQQFQLKDAPIKETVVIPKDIARIPLDYPPQHARPEAMVHHLWVNSSLHLVTNIPKDHEVDISCSQWGYAEKLDDIIRKNVTLRLAKDPGQIIETTWQRSGSSNIPGQVCSGYLIPANPLKDQEDYLVWIDPQDGIETVLEKCYFHTGSLPRVNGVYFKYSQKIPDWLESVTVNFSEVMAGASLAGKISLKRGSDGTVISDTLGSTASPYLTSVQVLVNNTVDPKELIKVEVLGQVEAKSGAILDGKNTGTAGSGDFTVEVKPSDLPANMWSVELGF